MFSQNNVMKYYDMINSQMLFVTEVHCINNLTEHEHTKGSLLFRREE